MTTQTLSQPEQAIVDDIAARDANLRADLRRFVDIPTGHNHAPGLDELRGIIAGRLCALGATKDLVPGDPRPNWLLPSGAGDAIPPTLICRRDTGTGPRILLVGHLDTVFDPAGPFTSMRVSDDGTTAIGPGVVDMKGGLLVAITALEALEQQGVRANWTFVLNSDEETGSFCSDRTLETEAKHHDVGLVFEPALPSGALAIERRGSGQFMVETFGVSAHAGREFDKGRSAVYALARALTEVEKMCDLDAGITLNVGPITGGIATNIVPDHAAAWGNIRYPDPESADLIGGRLDALATKEAALPRVVVHRAFNRPAKPTNERVEKLALAARSCAESLGQALPFESTGGVCDGNILQHAGLPTIDTLGVRGGGLHTEQEWIDLSSLVQRAQLLALLIARITDSTADWTA